MANSPARTVLDVGSVIADTYKIEGLLGRGGMGAVFLASHQRLAGKRVAIKVLHTELEDAEIVARFKREADIAARLNHPNIVGVIDYNVAPDGTPYLVLDYLEGETLAQQIARGPMALPQVMSIVRQVGSALAAAHRGGIVHRDLKPQNIFLVPTEVDGRMVEIAKVLDFGISKIRGSQTVKTQDSALLGTPQYMAPEQAIGQHSSVDERTDVFAFGAIVYEMLTGQPAFSGASIPEVVFKVVYEQPLPLAQQAPTVPATVVSAVNQAMAKPADERFATVGGFVEALTGQPITLPRGPLATAETPVANPSSGRGLAVQDAFAHTMGPADSGSAADAVLATAAPPTRRGGGPDPGAARQLATGTANAGNTPAAPIPVAAPTVDLHSRHSEPAPPPRKMGAIAAVIGLLVVGAGAGVYLTTRGSSPDPVPPVAVASHAATAPAAPPSPPAPIPPPSPPTTQPATAPPETPPEAPVAPTPPEPAGSGAKPTKPPAKPAKPTPARPANAAGDDDDDDNGDDATRAKLQQAQAALASHDYDLAERLANAVKNAAASPKQRALAWMIDGTVQCAARNNQEGANIALRRLESFRAMRARLLNACRRSGVLLR